jgi:hypothetical protein
MQKLGENNLTMAKEPAGAKGVVHIQVLSKNTRLCFADNVSEKWRRVWDLISINNGSMT